MKTKPYRVLVLPDVHLKYDGGGEDGEAIASVFAYAREFAWDEVIQLGDLMDFDYASKYTRARTDIIANSHFKEDYEYANDWYDGFLNAVRARNKKAKVTQLLGNHDIRPDTIAQADPRFRGSIEIENNLHFAKRKVDLVPYWRDHEPYQIGKALFIHGMYTGLSHAKKTVDVFAKSVFYGHTHDIQCHSRVLHGRNGTVVGQSMGTLCHYKQGYIGGKPTDWQKAFGVFHFRPDGYYNYYVTQIHDGGFVSPEGEYVKA